MDLFHSPLIFFGVVVEHITAFPCWLSGIPGQELAFHHSSSSPIRSAKKLKKVTFIPPVTPESFTGPASPRSPDCQNIFPQEKIRPMTSNLKSTIHNPKFSHSFREKIKKSDFYSSCDS